jgi:hypothetical protein
VITVAQPTDGDAAKTSVNVSEYGALSTDVPVRQAGEVQRHEVDGGVCKQDEKILRLQVFMCLSLFVLRIIRYCVRKL